MRQLKKKRNNLQLKLILSTLSTFFFFLRLEWHSHMIQPQLLYKMGMLSNVTLRKKYVCIMKDAQN